MFGRWLVAACIALGAIAAAGGSAHADGRARAAAPASVALWASLRPVHAVERVSKDDDGPRWRRTLRAPILRNDAPDGDLDALERKWDELADRAAHKVGKLATARWRMHVGPGQPDTGGGTLGVATVW